MLEQINEALKPIKETLNADGADLNIQVDGNNLKLEIVVSEETCMECLLPKQIISNIIEKTLSDKGIFYESIDLTYPAV